MEFVAIVEILSIIEHSLDKNSTFTNGANKLLGQNGDKFMKKHAKKTET